MISNDGTIPKHPSTTRLMTFHPMTLPTTYTNSSIGYTMNDFVAVVVAQLAEWPLPTPKVEGSNPVIGTVLYTTHWMTIIKNCRSREFLPLYFSLFNKVYNKRSIII